MSTNGTINKKKIEVRKIRKKFIRPSDIFFVELRKNNFERFFYRYPKAKTSEA